MSPVSQILFVDDELRVLESLRDLLRKQRHRWNVEIAHGGDAALRILSERSFDVVVTDLRMPVVDGFAVLEHLIEHHPKTVRLALSGDTQRETAVKLVPQAHRALAKPCRADELQLALESACALGALVADDDLRRMIGRIGDLPPMPQTYAHLVRVLEEDRSSLADIANVIARDIALSAKVLQLANSALFGARNVVKSVLDAIAFLGIDLIRTVALSQGAFTRRELPVDKRVFFASVHAHSTRVAEIAAELAPDPATRREVFAAAMLHDVGRLVMVLESIATDAARSDDDDTHARIGAYLLGLWGVPATIIAAVADHHDPQIADPGSLARLIGEAHALVDQAEKLPAKSNLLRRARPSG